MFRKTKSVETDPNKKVVDLASYRKSKTINYIPSGHEGA
jgi:hypothetical protein